MKGRAFIETLRKNAKTFRDAVDPVGAGEYDLLADAVEEADGAFRDLVESEAWMLVDDWWDTSVADDHVRQHLERAISYLERRGLLERKAGEPHMIMFVED